MSTTRYVAHQYSLPSQSLIRNKMKKKHAGIAVKAAERKRFNVDMKTSTATLPPRAYQRLSV
jgi:hypothetical protein